MDRTGHRDRSWIEEESRARAAAEAAWPGVLMGALTRPDLPPGPRRELADALHELHHRAGWPSLRTLGREVGCSPTTVSAVFSSSRLPSWGLLELLVEAMSGDVTEFRRLWLASGTPLRPARSVGAGIAGRRHELDVVRSHVEGGVGLLLVTGEAGIGKTRLVDTAANTTSDTFVARGSCLPLASRVPLLAITDALRAVYESDGGQWFKEALADYAPYVVASLLPLLPELGHRVDATSTEDDAWWQQRLFSAVGATLSALAGTRDLAVLVEDLHWADTMTLDLVEHLLARAPRCRLVGTYRMSDPATPAGTSDWLARIRRLPSVTSLELGPLTRDESAELLELIGASTTPDDVDRIYRRSAGLPLFTEQLAVQSAAGEALPELLVDLLDRRLAHLGEEEWAIARALGVADRPLSDRQLRTVTGLPGGSLTARLRALDGNRLTAPAGDREVRLAHPLLAEAVRRRLVAGEAAEEHRRLAVALAESPAPAAAEIAEHWQRADEPAQEIVWRIRAAQAAGDRFAAVQAAEQWRRVLDLWPEDADQAGAPAVRKTDAYVAAVDALERVDWQAADELAQDALGSVTDSPERGVARLYLRAGELRGNLGDPAAGLELIDRALEVIDPGHEPVEWVRALLSRSLVLWALGRTGESAAAENAAAENAAAFGDRFLYRRALIELALRDFIDDRLEQALEKINRAASVRTESPDPLGDVKVAVIHTHILGTASRSADEVVAAARLGLEAASAWDIDDEQVAFLLYNLSEALRRAGRVREAARLVDPVTDDPPTPHRTPIYVQRSLLDMLRGRRREALGLIAAIDGHYVVSPENRARDAVDVATVELSCGCPRSAYDRLTSLLTDVAGIDDELIDVGELLALAARAGADLADAAGTERGTEPGYRARLVDELNGFLATTARDPFHLRKTIGNRAALKALWTAEMSRLSGMSRLDHWVAAAAEWDKIGRLHDSAYCRWRGAQSALATGHASVATTLLRRAERDAGEHVPLLEAIRATRSAR